MTLNCSANNCFYNNLGICYAGSIEISGANATTTSNTTCSTFMPQNNNLSNQTSNTFTTSSDIACKATKCNFNSCGTCTASSVQINFSNTSCDTFIC